MRLCFLSFSLQIFLRNHWSNILKLLPLDEVDELYSHRVSSRLPDLTDPQAHHLSARGDQHDFVVLISGQSSNDFAGSISGLHRDDSFPTARLQTIFLEVGSFSDAISSGDEQFGVSNDLCDTDDFISRFGPDTPDADRVPPHVSSIVFLKPDTHPVFGDEHHFFTAVGQESIDQLVFLLDLNGDNASSANIGEFRKIGFFHQTVPGGKHDMKVRVPGGFFGRTFFLFCFYAQRGSDFLLLTQFEKICDRAPFGRSAHFGNLVDLFHVAAAGLGEEHQVIVRACGEQMLDEIPFLALGHAPSRVAMPMTPAAAALRPELAFRRAFDEATVSDGDDAAFVGDEILDVDLAFVRGRFASAALNRICPEPLRSSSLMMRHHAVCPIQECRRRSLMRLEKFAVFARDLFAFQPGELVEAKIEDLIGLVFAKSITAVGQAALRSG